MKTSKVYTRKVVFLVAMTSLIMSQSGQAYEIECPYQVVTGKKIYGPHPEWHTSGKGEITGGPDHGPSTVTFKGDTVYHNVEDFEFFKVSIKEDKLRCYYRPRPGRVQAFVETDNLYGCTLPGSKDYSFNCSGVGGVRPHRK